MKKRIDQLTRTCPSVGKLLLLYLLSTNWCFAQNKLFVSADGQIEAESGSIIQINNGDFENEGQANFRGDVIMNDSDNAVIKNMSAQPIFFDKMELITGAFALTGRINIGNEIKLSSFADLHLNANGQIDIGSTGTILNEDESHVISGDDGAAISTIRTVGTTTNNFGNIGVVLNSASNSPEAMLVTRKYGNGQINGNSIVKRYYEIQAENNTDLNADVTFHYAKIDLNGLDETILALFRSTGGIDNWQERGGTVDLLGNTIRLSGIDAFSTWAMSESGTVLPVKLTFFDAEAIDNNYVLCTWQTASEVDNSHFEVQRSKDGLAFELVGQVAGAGDSTSLIDYDFTDEQPFAGTSFYRLRQVDVDGGFEYSEIREVFIDVSTGIVLYPNPTAELINLSIPEERTVKQYRILNINGQVMQQGGLTQQTQLNVSQLKQGAYFIEILFNNETTHSIKFIKN